MAKKTIAQQLEALQGKLEEVDWRFKNELEEFVKQAGFIVALDNEKDAVEAEIQAFKEANDLLPKPEKKNEDDLEDDNQ